jgi:hypothetical protein
MPSATLPLEIDKGVPLKLPLQLCEDSAGTPMDITGCTFTAAIRPHAGADPALNLTVAPVDETTGKIEITATDEETDALTGDNAWNLIMTDSNGDKFVLLRGPVKLIGVIHPEPQP